MIDHLPTLDEMQITADTLIDEAVAEQLPGFVSALIEGMKPDAQAYVQAGGSKDELKSLAEDTIRKHVGLFDNSPDKHTAEEAVAAFFDYIDSL